MESNQSPSSESSFALQCGEIWGGNQAVENLVSVPGIDAWIHSQPWHDDANGGDLYYLSMCDAGQVARFAIADVSGHGESVSAFAQSLRDLMRKNINRPDQRRLARSLNKAFGEESTEGRFATALIGTYLASTDQLLVCNAGHPPPLWYRAEIDQWSLLEGQTKVAEVGNLPLGILDEMAYEQFGVTLGRGDLVVIYTDALPESADENGRMLGSDGLLELIRTLPVEDPAAIGPHLLEAVNHQQAADQAGDDVTVLVLHHNAADPPKLTFRDRVRITARLLGLQRDDD